jgi:3-oxoacid CoA-transferase subunit B
VHRIITEIAVMDVTQNGLVLREVAPGVSPDEVAKRTEPELSVATDLREVQLG